MSHSQQAISEKTEQKVSTHNSEQTDTSLATTSELQTAEDVVVTTKEYDTSLPIDEMTGKPPLKKETTSSRRKTQQAKQVALGTQTKSTETQQDSQVQQQTQTQTKTATKEVRGLNSIQILFSALGSILLGFGLWKLLKRFYKPF